MKATQELEYVVKPACAAPGSPRSIVAESTTGHQQPRPTPARALSERERGKIFDTLRAVRGPSPSRRRLDEDVYLCERTMYAFCFPGAGSGAPRAAAIPTRNPS